MKRQRSKFIQKDSVGNLYCYSCKDYKDPSSFGVNSSNHYRDNKARKCSECRAKHYKIRRIQNRGDCGIERLLTERYCGIRDRARKSGLVVDFSKDYLRELWIKQDGRCAMSGVQMTTLVFSGRVPTNISVDRIDSTKGYLKNNVQLVCMAVNQMKNDLTQEELVYFCKEIIKTYESKKQ